MGKNIKPLVTLHHENVAKEYSHSPSCCVIVIFLIIARLFYSATLVI